MKLGQKFYALRNYDENRISIDKKSGYLNVDIPNKF